MKFLAMRRDKNTGHVVAYIREKIYKFGDVVGSENISPKKRFIVMSGKTSSGKTRYMQRLYDDAEGIWRAQLRPYSFTDNRRAMKSRDDRPAFNKKRGEIDWRFPTPVFIPVMSEQAQWLEHPHVIEWWNAQEGHELFKKLKTHEKRGAVVEYLRVTRAVLFVDDLDKVSPKKLPFFKDMLNVASRVVVTSTTFNQIPQALRLIMMRDESWLQHIELTTDASFDATHLVMLLVIIACALSGQWAVAAFASAVYALINKGKFATKF